MIEKSRESRKNVITGFVLGVGISVITLLVPAPAAANGGGGSCGAGQCVYASQCYSDGACVGPYQQYCNSGMLLAPGTC